MCCPSEAVGYLESQGGSKGKVTDEYGVPCYATGEGKNVVVVLPDVWGWNGGRVRLLADELAEKLGAVAVVPKALQPPFEGGTDGDGLPPNFSLGERMGELFAYIKEKWIWDLVGKDFEKVIEAVSAKHDKIVLVGFCYGGYAAAHLGKEKSKIVGAAIAHPSTHLHEGLGLGKTVDLASNVTFPFAFYPAGKGEGGDPETYDADGEVFKALQEKFGDKCETHRYPDESHGFVTRGYLPEGNTTTGRGEATQKAIVDCAGRITTYLKARLQ